MSDLLTGPLYKGSGRTQYGMRTAVWSLGLLVALMSGRAARAQANWWEDWKKGPTLGPSKPQQLRDFKYVQDRLAGWALPPGYTFNDGSCELAGAGQGAGKGAEQEAVLVGSEDMAMGRHGLLFITRFANILQ